MVLEIFFFTLIIISLSYHIIVLIQTTKNFRKDENFLKKTEENSYFPRVSILKPLKGIDDELYENLKSFFELDYPDYEIIFGFHSSDDPALKIVQEISENHKHILSKIVVSEREIGLNPKVNNLTNIFPHATGEIIFISDSNTRVKKDFLRNIIRYLSDEEVGLVSAAIKGMGSRNLFALFENLHLNTFIVGIVQAASSIANIQITIGKAILVRKSILDKLDVFNFLKDFLAEDHLLGLEVKRLGYKIITSTISIENVNQNWSFKKLTNRHRRWTLMRLKIDPFFYLLESITNTTLLSIILIILNFNYFPIALFAIILKIIFDYLLSKIFKTELSAKHFLFVPIKDILIGILWFTPFFSNKISWRESRLKVSANSKLIAVKK